MTSVDLAKPLSSFLHRVSISFSGELLRAAEELRFPAHDRGTLVGSMMASRVWSSAEARELLDALLSLAELAKYFDHTTAGVTELRASISSVVRAFATANETPEQFSAKRAEAMLRSMSEENRNVAGFGIIYGITAPAPADLGYGLGVDPGVETMLESFTRQSFLRPSELVKMRSGYGCLFVAHHVVSRGEMGHLAATSALAWIPVAFLRLCQAIWLATGKQPVVGDVFAIETCPYPSVPFTHIHAGLQPSLTVDNALLSNEFIESTREMLRRLNCFWSDESAKLERETELSIRLVLSHAEVIRDSKDTLITALLVHVALDALLMSTEDDDSRLGPRVAWLIGLDSNERRKLRRFLADLRDLRGKIAHGNEPSLQTLSRLVDEPLSADDFSVYFSWAGRASGQLLDRRNREILRRCISCVLHWGIVISADGQCSQSLTRRELIQKIESADQGDLTDQRLFEDAAKLLFSSPTL